MGRLERVLVAITAVVAVAVTSAAGMALWWLWRQPIPLKTVRSSRGPAWRLGTITAELQLRDGAFDQLIVWRGSEGMGVDWPKDANAAP